MKRSILLSIAIQLFWIPAAGRAQKAEDYPLTVHVYRTGAITVNGLYTDCLEVTIEGRKLTLASSSGAMKSAFKGTPISMKTGDYKARILKEDQVNVAEYTRRYEFLLSDGKKLEFDVIGESE